MTPIVEFLNHGVMPFAGRGGEIEQILLFARQTIDAPELRLSLIVGEAGVGKSRLAAEVLPRLAVEGVLPLHVRLYPDTTISIITALAEAINHAPQVARLLRGRVEPGVASLVTALRRLSGLRVLLLVIEDLHLLQGNSLREFSQLCSSLFNESISIVALARPLSGDVRSAIEPYLGEETRLSGLSNSEVDRLWKDMLQSENRETVEELLRRLHEVTGGNPLTIRSALRGAFRKGMIATDGSFDTGTIDEITALFRQGARRFGEGLAVHLSDEERVALESLACLGEILSAEAAEMLLEERGPSLLEQLLFKGVLVEASGAATPLASDRSNRPLLRFTHTLVHRQALEHGRSRPVDDLYRVIAAKAPLYSHLPLELIAEGEVSQPVGKDLLLGLLASIWTIMTYVDTSVEWHRVPDLIDLRDQLFERHGALLPGSDHDYYSTLYALQRAILLRRDREKLERLSAEGIELTEGFVDREAADEQEKTRNLGLRLQALHNRALVEDGTEELVRFFEEARRIFEIAPSLRNHKDGVNLLRFILLRMSGESEWTFLRRVESEVDRNLLNQENAPWGVSHLFLMLALLYDTPEEFRVREEQVRNLERPKDWKSVRILYPLLRWYYDAGYIDRYLSQVWPANELYRQHQARAYVVDHTGHGRLMEYLQRYEEVDVEGTLESLAYDEIFHGDDCRRGHNDLFARFALMRGDTERARAAAEKVEGLAMPSAILLGGKPEEGDGDSYGTPEYHRDLLRAHNTLLSGEEPSDEDVDLIAGLLARSPLRITDPLLLQTALDLATRAIERTRVAAVEDRLRESSAETVRGLLAWYLDEKRRIVPPAEHLLATYGDLLGEELTVWRRRAKKSREEQLETEEFARRSGSGLARLRVIGRIAIRHPGEEERTLRGERVSACVGALVANSLLTRRLEMVDFARLATGEEEPDHARKILKVALFRTREALGPSAIEQIDRESAPVINREVLSVDLIDLADAVALGASELSHGGLTRALREAHRALDLFGEDVVLPGLYDRVFEAIREEQEARLRSLIVGLAERLNEEGDLHSAELLLRHALGVMPEDEEVAELLQEVLRGQGNLTDAELVTVV